MPNMCYYMLMNEQNLKGVSISYKKDGTKYYRSSITYKNKHISLGSYDTAEMAHQAYWEGALILMRPSMTLSEYNETNILQYRKWVILINFRDNNIYLSAPIYLKPNYFEYHLDPDNILKFSTDDLFYYSHKQIMKRGRHFFVSDYGMQVNILNRYGIKNYAVPGRDFVFKNSDDMDFRYENIQILNTYHGVTVKMNKTGLVYTARIHINGNYTIGRYKSDIEAAIAYNKAIDILKQKGVKKNFTPNYIEDIAPSKYALIYTEANISSKILNYSIE